HFAVGEHVILLIALSDAFALCVEEGEAIRGFGSFDDCRLGNGRLRKRDSVNSRPIGGRGEQTNSDKSVHEDSSELFGWVQYKTNEVRGKSHLMVIRHR